MAAAVVICGSACAICVMAGATTTAGCRHRIGRIRGCGSSLVVSSTSVVSLGFLMYLHRGFHGLTINFVGPTFVVQQCNSECVHPFSLRRHLEPRHVKSIEFLAVNAEDCIPFAGGVSLVRRLGELKAAGNYLQVVPTQFILVGNNLHGHGRHCLNGIHHGPHVVVAH